MGSRHSSGIVPQVTSEIEILGSDRLSLSSAGVSDQDILQLCMLLKRSRAVKELRLKNCFVNHVGTRHIANVLEETSIQRLFLSCNIGIRDRGALQLMVTLPSSCVEELSLDTTNITDKTARALASILPKCKIKTLYLGGNDISDFGVSLLAEALPRSNVTKLYLSSSKIRDLGARSLSEAMRKHPLEVLTLSANYISDLGAKFLAEALVYCPTLQKLDLSCNDLTDESVNRFILAVDKHPRIRTVSFQYTATSASRIQDLNFKIAFLHTRKAKIMTLLSASCMPSSRDSTIQPPPVADLPIELIRYLSQMLFG